MITLSSDFGWPYPAAMRGVLAARTDARLIDITHQFPRGDIRTAAFWLRELLPYFPAAVHLVVVDPGVGTDRNVLVIRAGDHLLVGPDNGVLLPAARALSARVACFELPEFDSESATFHGRDVFAPLAARVHEWGPDSLEPREELRQPADVVEYRLPEPELTAFHAKGEVLVVDGFGNAITNIPGERLGDHFGTTVEVNGESILARRSYAQVTEGEPLVTVGSHGNVELAVNGGSGAEWFALAPGDAVTLVT